MESLTKNLMIRVLDKARAMLDEMATAINHADLALPAISRLFSDACQAMSVWEKLQADVRSTTTAWQSVVEKDAPPAAAISTDDTEELLESPKQEPQKNTPEQQTPPNPEHNPPEQEPKMPVKVELSSSSGEEEEDDNDKYENNSESSSDCSVPGTPACLASAAFSCHHCPNCSHPHHWCE